MESQESLVQTSSTAKKSSTSQVSSCPPVFFRMRRGANLLKIKSRTLLLMVCCVVTICVGGGSLPSSTDSRRTLTSVPLVERLCHHTSGPAHLEQHGVRQHGDVCRFQDASLGFFCPEGCLQALGPPFCVEKTYGYPPLPCRVATQEGGRTVEEEAAAAAAKRSAISAAKASAAAKETAREARVSSPAVEAMAAAAAASAASVSGGAAGTGHPACDASEDAERTPGAALSRHTLEAEHGDVCRPEGRSDYFCPVSCAHLHAAPWCAARAVEGAAALLLGGLREPCRVAAEKTMSVYEKLGALSQVNRLICFV